MSLNDEEIAAKVQAGDKAQFAVLVERYEKPLVYYAWRLAGSKESAEDIVQEAFLKSYRDINSFDPTRKFSSWIYRIVHNEAINLLRKTRITLDLENLPELTDERNLAKEIEQKIDTKKQKEKLLAALNKVPVKYREILNLRYFEEMQYEEIAEILHLPINTVGTLLKRGKEKLRLEMNIEKRELL